MIELLISACLASGADCKEFPLLYSTYDVSMMTCVTMGQAEVAAWQAAHPQWEVTRWQCSLPDLRSARI